MIAVDVDNTIADTWPVLRAFLRVPKSVPISQYDLSDHGATSTWWQSREAVLLLSALRPLPGAQQALALIPKPLVYITGRPHLAEDATARWLSDHEFPDGELIVAGSPAAKMALLDELHPDVVFEDDPAALVFLSARSIVTVAQDQPYNRGIAVLRQNGWTESDIIIPKRIG